MSWIYIWLIVFAVTMAVEFFTFELVSVWMSVGSLVALILAFCGVGYEIQIIVAVAVSLGCLLGLRKVALKYLTKNKDTTNLDSAIGTNLKVISGNADDEFGTVKYNGVVWNVKTEDGAKIKAGDNVEVLRVEGTKFIVKKAKKEHKGEQK